MSLVGTFPGRERGTFHLPLGFYSLLGSRSSGSRLAVSAALRLAAPRRALQLTRTSLFLLFDFCILFLQMRNTHSA